ncbi:hypothetical protein CRUP_015792 [Coryphaenoides rupestris]|nr:hypothetical protein CRUP_015792 [Coryphaenoides rupestris]
MSSHRGSKRSLLDEGTLMNRLCHERVVKLLGVIMEDGDYSLVMELIPKGNLQTMLQQVPVPISIKGRITLEILEGMVYLTQNNVIHKDLKPENILVDKDFHIKIADLGLATCQSWSKLTREETRRKSRTGCTVGTRGAGTLSYMAPEHLNDINTRSTEKSDVYSFAIVLWVILTCREPYENARCEDQLCMCVRNGGRPEVEWIARDTPTEMVELMERCWQQNPQKRPTFQEGYNDLLPFYKNNLEEFIEKDCLNFRKLYDGPEGLVEKMKSLTVPPDLSTDSPAPLLSSDRSAPPGPVEASIEDLHLFSCRTSVEVPPADHIQADARVVAANGGSGPTLEQKLDMELQYHKNGNYPYVSQPDSAHACQLAPATASQPYPEGTSSPLRRAISNPVGRPYPEEQHQHHPPMLSSVRPASAELSKDAGFQPISSPNESMASSGSGKSQYQPASSSTPSLVEQHQQGSSQYDRQISWPPDFAAGLRAPNKFWAPNKIGPLQDSGSQGLFIHNASGVQIGHNNSMSIRGSDSSVGGLSTLHKEGSALQDLKDALQRYEHQAVTEEHLNLLRDNIGSNWKQCARRLGLTNVDVEAVDHDYSRDGLQEKVHQMLERWRMKEGSLGCTVGKLCQALDGLITVDVIHKLLSTCRNTPHTV